MTDDDFLAALGDGSLPPDDFDHAAHVRAAWLCLRRRGFAGGMAVLRDLLRGFATRHGVPEKYHETITVAFLTLIHERLHAAACSEDWPGFAARHPDLFERDILRRYYRPETLASPQARTIFVLEPRA